MNHQLSVGVEYTILHLVRLNWQLRSSLCTGRDLDKPLLGEHSLASTGQTLLVVFGRPSPAWGLKKCRSPQAEELALTPTNLAVLARRCLANLGEFRHYVQEQAYLALPSLMLPADQCLIPAVRSVHIELSQKLGICFQMSTTSSSTWKTTWLACRVPEDPM